VTSFLYWQDVQFGLKPTLRISHLSIREGPEDTVVASKMLYARHYFWTALELRTLVPDPSRGQGFWFFTTRRSRVRRLKPFRRAFWCAVASAMAIETAYLPRSLRRSASSSAEAEFRL
jgi:hypothetical protein